MKFLILLTFTFTIFNSFSSFGQKDSTFIIIPKSKLEPNSLIASSEVLGSNLIINRFDAWVQNVDWAKVTPNDWARNMQNGFQTDGDPFGTNFFGHPFHGALFYNTARHNGHSFLESIPYVMIGSWTWEYFGETYPPSEIDWNTTTLGGIFLGEISHRLSIALLRNNSNRKNKIFRNSIATIINPMIQLNGLLNKDIYFFARSNYRKDINVNIQLGLGATFAKKTSLNKNHYNISHVKFKLIYGNKFNTDDKAEAFDYFKLDSWMDFSTINKHFYFNLLGDAQLWKENINNIQNISVSQHFAYINNELFKFGALSITGDYNQRVKFNDFTISNSLKSGFILFGSASSEAVVVDEIFNEDGGEFLRDYVYGKGIYFEGALSLENELYGYLTSSYNNWILFTESDKHGTETVSVFKLEYQYPLNKSLRIGSEYFLYSRNAKYPEIEKLENVRDYYWEIKASAYYNF